MVFSQKFNFYINIFIIFFKFQDQTAKLWNVETGKEVATLKGHTGEIVSLHFNADGDKILTGSFDKTARVKTIYLN